MKKRATLGLVLGFLAIGTAFSSAESMARLWLQKEAIAEHGVQVSAESVGIDEHGRSVLRFETELGAIVRIREEALPWGLGATVPVGDSVPLWYDPVHSERCTSEPALWAVRWLLGGLAVLFSAGVALVLAGVRALRLPARLCR